MNAKSVAVSLGVVLAVGVGAYLTYKPGTGNPAGEGAVDKVETAAAGVSELMGQISTKMPKPTITAYRPVTDELLKGNALPKAFVQGGSAKNAWGGNVVVQVFPRNAWGAGIAETVNVVIESLPENDCSNLVQQLSRIGPEGIFQINVEPSKKVHKSFPVAGDTGCTMGNNNIGYTAYAK